MRAFRSSMSSYAVFTDVINDVWENDASRKWASNLRDVTLTAVLCLVLVEFKNNDQRLLRSYENTYLNEKRLKLLSVSDVREEIEVVDINDQIASTKRLMILRKQSIHKLSSSVKSSIILYAKLTSCSSLMRSMRNDFECTIRMRLSSTIVLVSSDKDRSLSCIHHWDVIVLRKKMIWENKTLIEQLT